MNTGYRGLLLLAGMVALVAILAPSARAYTQVSSCLGCHSDWQSGNPSPHDMHQDFVNDCRDCHKSSLSTALSTNSSANYANYGCNGCHIKAGLATKHGSANCGCHSGVIGTMAGEHVLPYYYQNGRSAIVNPCRANAANGGEDWDGNGTGLDNDGDGQRDAADADCEGIVPVMQDAWSTLKTLFGN